MKRFHLTVLLVFAIIISSFSQKVVELKRFSALNATQAVAVDSQYFYTISNAKIVKRNKMNGDSIASWSGPLQHLNSGIVIGGKLYCANTNYPETPMASSLEIYDPVSMKHIASKSFGIFAGSFTWIDRLEDRWYAMFVHYENRAQDLGRTVAYTQFIEFDNEWRRTGGWILPKDLVKHLNPMAVSGGTFMEQGKMLLSPHHFEELYLFDFPKMGYELEWLGTIDVPFQGQGLAIDPYEAQVYWGIHRKNKEVIKIRIEY